MQDFRKLKVWGRSCELIRLIYSLTAAFPRQEMWGIVIQIRRAVVSIATNISEGCGRKGGADFMRFLYFAVGSASEVECCLEISCQLGFVKERDREAAVAAVTEVRSMLGALIRTLAMHNG